MSSTRYARPLRNEVTRLGPAKLAPSSASKARCRRDYSDLASKGQEHMSGPTSKPDVVGPDGYKQMAS